MSRVDPRYEIYYHTFPSLRGELFRRPQRFYFAETDSLRDAARCRAEIAAQHPDAVIYDTVHRINLGAERVDRELMLERIKELEAKTATSDYVLVPRVPTRQMLDYAYESALGEDAGGVWNDMIDYFERNGLED